MHAKAAFMRPLLVTLMMLPCLACDKDDKAKELEQKVAGSATTAAATTSAPPPAAVDAAAAPTASVKMPDRPIPIFGMNGVEPSVPAQLVERLPGERSPAGLVRYELARRPRRGRFDSGGINV